MTKTTIAIALSAALALAACQQKNEDTLNSDMNTADANLILSANNVDESANAEAQALGNQEAQLESENKAATNPSDADEQNVAGM